MTTRDQDAIQIEKWAATGDVETPENNGLTRSVGWPSSYSQVGGDTLSREVHNQIFREITGALNELNTRGGILPWDMAISYVHPAQVYGSDGIIYVSVRNNTGVNPTTDADASDWKPQLREALSQIISTDGITDYDDLALPPGALIGYAFVTSSLTDNRPLGYAGSGLLMQYRAPGGVPHQWQIVYPHSPTTPHGITFFQRRQHGTSGNWGAWGTIPTFFSAVCSDATITNPALHADSSNVTNITRNGAGAFQVTIALDAPSGRVASVQATAQQTGGDVRTMQLTQVVHTEVDLQCYDENGVLQNPARFYVNGFLSVGPAAS